MYRVLIALGVAVVAGAVYFALQPQTAPKKKPPAAKATPKIAKTPKLKRGALGDPETRTRKRRQVKGKQTAANPKPRRFVHNALPQPAVQGGKIKLPNPGPKPGGEVPVERKHGRKPGSGQLKYPVGALKDSLRRFYGNLPKSGGMPSRIEVDELLPADLVRALNVPEGSTIAEIAHYQADDRKGLEQALAIAEDHQGHLGLTIVTPDGERIREYILTQP